MTDGGIGGTALIRFFPLATTAVRQSREDKSEANIYETMQTPLSRMAFLFSPETPEKKRETPAAGRGVAPISAPYVSKLLMLLFWHDAEISLIASRH